MAKSSGGGGGGSSTSMESLTIALIVGGGAMLPLLFIYSGFHVFASIRAGTPGGHWALGILIAVGVGVAAVAYGLLQRPGTKEHVLSGPTMGTVSTLNRLERAQVARSGKGLKLGDWQISKYRETTHFLVSGLPGAGKTVLLSSMIAQALARRERLIIHDPKGDFSAWVPNALIYAPWDRRSVIWDLSKDLSTAAEIMDFAQGLIPSADAGPNAHFNEASQKVFFGLSNACRKEGGVTAVRLRDRIAHDQVDVAEAAIEGARDSKTGLSSVEPMVSFETDESGKRVLTRETASVISTLINKLQWVYQLAAVEEADALLPEDQRAERFSIKEYFSKSALLESPRPLILQNDSKVQNIAKDIFATFIQVMAKQIASVSMPEVKADEPGTWLILDEYPQLGKAAGQSIKQIQEVGRSKGVRVCLGLQDVSQLFAVFGKDEGRAQMSMQQTWIIGPSANETASEMSRMLGNKQVMIISKNYGEQGIQRDTSQVQTLPSVEPQEITSLTPDKDGVNLIAVIRGQPARLKVPYPVLPEGGSGVQSIENPAFFDYVRSEPKDEIDETYGDQERQGLKVESEGLEVEGLEVEPEPEGLEVEPEALDIEVDPQPAAMRPSDPDNYDDEDFDDGEDVR